MVEAAHQYRFIPRVTPAIQKRQENQSKEVRAIAFKAQQRLHGRFTSLSRRHKKPVVVAAALARELCGFVWAIACQVNAPEMVKTRQPRVQKTTLTSAKRDYQLVPNKKFKP